jgi:hypothetical protein
LKAHRIACTHWQCARQRHSKAQSGTKSAGGEGWGWSSTRYSFLLDGEFFFTLAIFVLFFRDLAQYKTCGHFIENISCFGTVAWLHSEALALLCTTVSAFNMFYKLVSENQTYLLTYSMEQSPS